MKPSERTQQVLNEGRTLILGAQILIGLQYRAAFEPGYSRLPLSSEYLVLFGLALILFAFGLLTAPVPYHRIVERGGDQREFEGFVLRTMKPALFPFALSLGLTLYVAGRKVVSLGLGTIIAAAATAVALVLWYGPHRIFRSHAQGSAIQKQGGPKPEQGETEGPRGPNQQSKKQGSAGGELKDKIDHVLTEARMVLPGAQALMGFQFVIILMDDFDKLSRGLQEWHLLSLVLTAVSTVLLIMPAAYHRLVERGAETQEFYDLASRTVVGAMIPLGAGISADYYVCAQKVTGSHLFAAISALVLLLFFYGLWFGYSLYRKSRVTRRRLAQID